MMKELSPASTFPILNSYFPTASIKLCGLRNIDNRLTFHLYCSYLFKALWKYEIFTATIFFKLTYLWTRFRMKMFI